MKRWIIIFTLLTGTAFSQNTPTIGVLPDNGPSLPATCVIGQIYFRTATTIGLNQCNPANTWTALATGAGSTAFSSITSGTNTTASMIVGTGASLSSVPEFDIGAVGTNGVLGLLGTTSGKATITAPAVAGTATNPIVFSNAILVTPTGSGGNEAISIGASQGHEGFGSLAGNTMSVFANTAEVLRIGAQGLTGLNVGPSNVLGFSSGFGSNFDSVFSRISAGLISTDTTVAQNGLAALTNCRTVVNVTPVTVSTNTTSDQNLMAFTLPANCLNTVGRTLRIFVAGVYSTAATSTAQMTLKVKICSVSGCGSGNVASVISIQSAALGTLTITNNAWEGKFYVTTQTASTAGAWEAHGAFGIDEGALATAADSFFNDSNIATVTGTPSAIDTTAQNFLQISFAFSAASASNSSTQRQLVIDSVN